MTMKRISLLVYEDAVLSAIAGALELLTGTNRVLSDSGRPAAFKVELISEKLRNIHLNQQAQFICNRTILEAVESDLIIVPAFYGSPDVVLEKNRPLIEWIKEMSRRGTEVASLCVGSYFLAEAGFLSGKSCTSHWKAVDDMRRRYPDAEVLADSVVTDQDGIYTSGGAFSSLNLMLYLVEKFCGREVGIQVSKRFSVDMDRVSQAHFAVFQGQRGHTDEEILKAQSYIEQNYRRAITIEEIAERSNMSRRNFVRRFKQATHNTPLAYLQRVKVEAAKKALERGGASVGQLMYDVGYTDAKAFRELFKRYTGFTPQDYRRKYSRA